MNNQPNPFVSITHAVGWSVILLVAIVSIFAKESIWFLSPIVGVLALLGVFMGYFASKRR